MNKRDLTLEQLLVLQSEMRHAASICPEMVSSSFLCVCGLLFYKILAIA